MMSEWFSISRPPTKWFLLT